MDDTDHDLVSLKIALAGPDAGKNIHLLMRYAATVLDAHAGTLALQTNGVAVWKLDFFLPDEAITVHTHVCAAEADGEIHVPEMWTKLLTNADAVVLIGDDGSAGRSVRNYFDGGATAHPHVSEVAHDGELGQHLTRVIEDLRNATR